MDDKAVFVYDHDPELRRPIHSVIFARSKKKLLQSPSSLCRIIEFLVIERAEKMPVAN
jgi:hypothetical protein